MHSTNRRFKSSNASISPDKQIPEILLLEKNIYIVLWKKIKTCQGLFVLED